MSEQRYDRNIGLFGRPGQRAIANSRVAILGLGGLGSHVAQQLGYLGVLHYALVDPDIVTASSLNRSIGALPEDADLASSKVDVADRMIRQIQPAAAVRTFPHKLEDIDLKSVLADRTATFGCLDNDQARLHLTSAWPGGLAYIDLATDTGGEEDLWYGGRVLFARKGRGCLVCMGLLDQHALARASMTDDQLAADDRLYGVPRGQLGESGPSVVSVNAAIASIAVTEFMAWVTGLREPTRMIEYRADLPHMKINVDPPQPDCYYCS